ncbi:sensor histidine kinase [Domibacillus sp. PGB-M46]|uniref:ATP-binding protein n=1 Tax=Domibacillus sp. PGB-M46 TaxID=2910255 RepID=UPI001F57C7A7|nr:sensor histidine kinase [Domibacillus sp. PGB-M46]MCI2256657.1 sensor histidine kinase [Domibacillus sp. PGB-M46]
MNILFENSDTYLLNVFLAYFCFSIYFKFLERETSKFTSTLVITFVCGVFTIFCMSFPITIFKGNLIDFRQVPLVVGALYGGRKVALILTGILLGYRLYLGVPNFHIAFLLYSSICVLLFLVIPFFRKVDCLKRKLLIAAGTSVVSALITSIAVPLLSPAVFTLDYLLFIVIVVILQTTGVLFFVLANEKAKKNKILSNEIKKLEKLKTVSTIAASISHEVRNPLTITKGFLQLLREPNLSDKDKTFYINTALEALEKAEATITDYLTFAKPSLENIEILDLHEQLISLKNFIEPYAAMNNVVIEMKLEEDVYISGEKEKVHQCLINILKNGIEAMPQGGKLKISLNRLGNEATVTISDTGVGMNKEQLERLGTPFFTTKDIGTGLGTMVVYSVVKSMGGNITIDSKPGKGTRFSVVLPVAPKSI